MALDQLSSSDAGAAARNKINAAIAETGRVAGRVDGKADAAALPPILATSAAALAAAQTAGRMAPPSISRPGDGIRAFTFVSSLTQLAGEADALVPLGASLIAFAAAGGVVRMTGQGILAAREAEPIEPGRIREIRAAFRRRSNASDPSNDTVRSGLLWLDQTKTPLAGPAFTVIADLDTLTTASGRREVKAYVAGAVGDGVTIVAPPGAAYFRRFVHNFGLDGVTDIETLASDDITGLSIPPTVTTDLLNRVAQQESLNAGPRLTALEQTAGTPNLKTFPTVGDAASAAIATSVATIRTLGESEAGDGGGASHVRALPEQAADFTTQDGARWRQTLDGLSAALPTTYQGLSGFVPPKRLTNAVLIGYASAGDLGFGMPIRRIPAEAAPASKNQPRQDKLGRWWEIDPSNGVRPGWFGARYDDSTDDTAAHAAALASDAIDVLCHPGKTVAAGLVVPLNKVFRSAERSTRLRPPGQAGFIVKTGAGTTVSGFWIEGNNVAESGIINDGTLAIIENNYVTHCYFGLRNTAAGTAVRWYANYTALNTYGFYSIGGSNNSRWVSHTSQSESFGAFFTYTGNPDHDQPQAVNFASALFFGNTNAIWFDKNVFCFSFAHGVIDGCTGTAIRIAPGSSSVRIGPANFIAGSGVTIDIGEGTNDIEIFSNHAIGNGAINILLRATSALRCRNVNIHNNGIGTSTSHAILCDSPDGTWSITDNAFAPYYPADANGNVAAQIAVIGTHPGSKKPIKVRRNKFPVNINPVVPYLTECSENEGWTTRQTLVAIMPAGATAVAVALSMSIAPTRVLSAQVQGGNLLGQIWADTLSPTGMLLHCEKAAPGGPTEIVITLAGDFVAGTA